VSQEQISLTPVDIKNDPTLINLWCEIYQKSNPKIKTYEIGALAKKEFNKKNGIHKILHENTINNYINPMYKNPTKIRFAKKAVHPKSLKSRLIQKVKNLKDADLMSVAKLLNEPIEYVSK